MDRSFRIYLLAVCFVSVVCLAITSGISLYSMLKIAAPELTLDSYSYSAHQSNSNFTGSHFYAKNFAPQTLFMSGNHATARSMAKRQSEVVVNNADNTKPQQHTDHQIEQLRQDSYRILINNHRRSAMQELIRTAIVLAVSSILFLAHWRLIGKLRRQPH